MLYWKVSPYRTFFLNEYWIFIPVMILVDYEIIRRVRKKRIRDEKLKKLKEFSERLKHNQRMALVYPILV